METVLNKIAKKYAIRLIIIYGSFVHQKKEPDDIDIAVFSEKKILLEEYGELLHFFSFYFKNSSKNIDLVILNNETPPLLGFQIVKSSKLLWSSRKEFLNWRAKAVKKYMDTEKFRELTDIYLKSKIYAGVR